MSQKLPLLDFTEIGVFVFEQDKEFVIYPLNKPPVCFRGVKVLSYDAFSDETGNMYGTYTLYLTVSGKLIAEYESNGYVDGEERSGYRKVKKLETLNDVWTFLSYIDQYYIDFLSLCAKKLEQPTLFWLKVE